MATLPAATDFTGSSITEAQFKTAITDLRTFLADQLGTAGTVAAALNALGALCNDYTLKTTAYTVIAGDRGKVFGCTGTFSLSLTAAATLGDGFSFAVRCISGTLTIDPNSSELIDGVSTLVFTAGQSCVITCTGTEWVTVGTMGAATASVNGYMSSTYAAKLDGIYDRGAGGIGIMCSMINNTGGTIASGGTASSGLNYLGSSAAASGTWRNIEGGSLPNGAPGAFQRIA